MSKSKALESVVFNDRDALRQLTRDIQAKLKDARRALVDSLRMTDECLAAVIRGSEDGGFNVCTDFDGNTWAEFPNGQRVMVEPAGGGDELAAERSAEKVTADLVSVVPAESIPAAEAVTDIDDGEDGDEAGDDDGGEEDDRDPEE